MKIALPRRFLAITLALSITSCNLYAYPAINSRNLNPEESLRNAITSGDSFKVYNFTENISLSSDLDATGGSDTELILRGNGFGLNGNNNKGLNINEGNTVHLMGIGSINNDGSIKERFGGFYSATDTERVNYASALHNAGTAFIEDSVFADNITSGKDSGYVYGGAIYNSGDLTVNNSVFKENTGSLPASFQPLGGAIYNDVKGNLTINDSLFENNHLTSPGSGAGLFGGSIANFGTATINNSIFRKHVISGNSIAGAVIHDSHYSGGSLTINNSIFEDNSASTTGSAASGGVLYAPKGNTNIYNSIFDSNTADSRLNLSTKGTVSSMGGALYLSSGIITIANSIFSNNIAVAGNLSSRSAYGGAIYSRGDINLIGMGADTVFRGNKSGKDGNLVSDSIYMVGGSDSNPLHLNINAGNGGKVIFDDRMGAGTYYVQININKEGTEGNSDQIPVWAPVNGEVQFNDMIKYNGTSTIVNNVNIYNGLVRLGYSSQSAADGAAVTNPDDNLGYSIINLQGGILSLANNHTGQVDWSNYKGSDSGKLHIDADFAQGTNDTITLKNYPLGKLNLSAINIISDNADVKSLKLFDKKGLSLYAPTLVNLNAYSNDYLYKLKANSSTKGLYDVSASLASAGGLNMSVLDSGKFKSFSANSDYTLKDDLGSLKGANSTLTILGNNKEIKGAGYGGINVSGGQNLDILDVGSFNGFASSAVIANAGNTNIYNASFASNTNGAVLNTCGSININDVSFTDNENASANGGAVNNIADAGIYNVSFDANSAQKGGAIYNEGNLSLANAHFTNNKAEISGGAIYNSGTVNILAGSDAVIFEGNTANGSSEAVALAGGSAKLNLNAYDRSVDTSLRSGAVSGIIFNDKITSDNIANEININNTASGEMQAMGDIVFNNEVSNSTINLYGGTLKLAAEGNLVNDNFNFNGGMLDLRNGSTGTLELNDINLNSDSSVGIDIDLAAGLTDKINVAGAVSGNGKLLVNTLNIVGDNREETIITPMVSDNLKDNIEFSKHTAYSPIYGYSFEYDAENGALIFAPKNTGSVTGYNPAVFTSQIAAKAGGYLAQQRVYDQALSNVGMYTDEMPENKDREFWFKPYSDFGDIPLKDGPTVDSVSYGALIGVDTYTRPMLFGANGYYSVYAGYTGANEKYEGIKIEQNGGIGGLGLNMYWENLFAALTLSAGYMDNKAQTSYGKDTFSLMTAGAALRSGYNIALGSFTLQPSVMGSYTYVNTEDYTNSADVKLNADALSVWQIAPRLKLTANLANGWKPALEAAAVWNFYDKDKFSVNQEVLPDISVDNYMEYGLNIQKIWTKDFSTYLKGMLRAQGLKGGSVQLGLKLAL